MQSLENKTNNEIKNNKVAKKLLKSLPLIGTGAYILLNLLTGRADAATLRGNVTDLLKKEPVPDLVVRYGYEGNITQTDQDGNFTLENATGQDMLRISESVNTLEQLKDYFNFHRLIDTSQDTIIRVQMMNKKDLDPRSVHPNILRKLRHVTCTDFGNTLKWWWHEKELPAFLGDFTNMYGIDYDSLARVEVIPAWRAKASYEGDTLELLYEVSHDSTFGVAYDYTTINSETHTNSYFPDLTPMHMTCYIANDWSQADIDILIREFKHETGWLFGWMSLSLDSYDIMSASCAGPGGDISRDEGLIARMWINMDNFTNLEWYTDDTLNLGIEEDDYVVIDKLDAKGYPNPVKDFFNLNYQLPSDGYVNVGIYNILGEKVFTFKDKQVKGKYNINWDGKIGSLYLPNGSYFYNITFTHIDNNGVDKSFMEQEKGRIVLMR